jgi:hypothetical protein
MLRGIDQSSRLTETIKWLSTALAKRRGLPIMIAVGLLVLSLLLHWVTVIFLPDNRLAMLCTSSVLHIGIITALIGILLLEPLGKG